MSVKLRQTDFDLLAAVAEYRILTVRQLEVLLDRSNRALRNRLKDLHSAGYVSAEGCGLGRTGRPETLVSVENRGVDVLRKRHILPERTTSKSVLAENYRPRKHQLLVNWFRIHLVYAERIRTRLAVRFETPTSPFSRGEGGKDITAVDRVKSNRQKRPAGFTPDGVFMITDNDQGKSLLFFLEVDRGTESAKSERYGHRSVHQKIINYQAYFRNGGYKRYEETWGRRFHGFRLLFLASTDAGLAKLCRMTLDAPPSDFVWLTDQNGMFEKGVTADIWVRGGKIQQPRQSILGSLSFHSAIPKKQS